MTSEEQRTRADEGFCRFCGERLLTSIANYKALLQRRCITGQKSITLYPNKQESTFVNEPLGHSSVIDYFISDMAEEILDYCVLDTDINLSDHLPIAIRIDATVITLLLRQPLE